MTNSRQHFSASPAIYLIATCAPGRKWADHLNRVEACLRAGIKIVQFREKDLEPSEILIRSRQTQSLAQRFNAAFVINDDPHLAHALSACALHLGQDDSDLAEARDIVGPEMVIGLSTHSLSQVESAASNPHLNYVAIGPVFKTTTKLAGPPIGPELAARAQDILPPNRPLFPIGGISLQNIQQLRRLGVHNAAISSALLDAPDPEQAAADLCRSRGVGS
ncbi:MAG: thiamine phosphate synthase [Planctomycetota bacterium]